MARPRKLAPDDRYAEPVEMNTEPYPGVEDGDGMLELGLSSRGERLAALREQDFAGGHY